MYYFTQTNLTERLLILVIEHVSIATDYLPFCQADYHQLHQKEQFVCID